jgi:hypothetical protein
MSGWFRVAIPLGIAAVLVSVLAIGFGSPSVDATRGGNGKGNGGSATATLFAEPAPADAGSVVRIKGCGFRNDRSAVVEIVHNGATDAYSVWVWGDGCIDFPYQTAEPGTYGLRAFQQSSPRMTLVAEGTLEVQ